MMGLLVRSSNWLAAMVQTHGAGEGISAIIFAEDLHTDGVREYQSMMRVVDEVFCICLALAIFAPPLGFPASSGRATG